MKKILVAGAGGAPTEGVIHSLLKNPNNYVIGMGSEPTDVILSKAHKKYYVPYANTTEYKDKLLGILNKEKPDLVHFQNDLEIYHASLIRKDIEATGTKTFMPVHSVIDACVHKYKSYQAFKKAGVVVPENIAINTEDDLKKAFKELGNEQGKVWLRDSGIGGGGKGALPTSDYKFAKAWIDHYKGWGAFIAAEMLTPKTVTWLSIWHEGELVVAQTRAREGWTHGNRTISGVTGVTKVGVTVSDDEVTRIAIKAVKAVDPKPNGIFGVDMAYDKNGVPNPTEINISRFFTTVRFFTEAGINFPEIFKNLALGDQINIEKGLINPLQDGLMWVRGMDTEPKLIVKESIEQGIKF
ncbi:MAG: ATP-grasp domain-containing protein [Gammaproteobacteria bacterium]|nr:ATP-grasp domain-containing protein [Gammaproteobacteria bacterium]